MANTYIAIATVTVGSGGTASIDFTNIPQTYTDLIIKISARESSGADLMFIRPNGNNTSLSYRAIYGQGTSPGAVTDATGLISWVNQGNDTANTFGSAEIYIPNYTSSNYKIFNTEGVSETNGVTADKSIVTTLWSNTAAITSLNIYPGSGQTFLQYSTATLYGISKS